MARISYVEANGAAHAIEVADGLSVMEGAVSNGIPGIDAECGGACACATCQVIVDAAWIDRLPPPSEMETDMLDFAEHAKPGARLSCQITVGAALDGLVVHTPESQR